MLVNSTKARSLMRSSALDLATGNLVRLTFSNSCDGPEHTRVSLACRSIRYEGRLRQTTVTVLGFVLEQSPNFTDAESLQTDQIVRSQVRLVLGNGGENAPSPSLEK
jgi:hypothetical protein